MQIRPVGAELFRADRQTDTPVCGPTDRHDEANSRFFAILRTGIKTGRNDRKKANKFLVSYGNMEQCGERAV